MSVGAVELFKGEAFVNPFASRNSGTLQEIPCTYHSEMQSRPCSCQLRRLGLHSDQRLGCKFQPRHWSSAVAIMNCNRFMSYSSWMLLSISMSFIPPSPQLPGLGDAAGLRADFKG